ncbi:hypothetical protein [Kistimonas asteriae]|uniref:hypothetical protein n=1 Tax=Kistimonas asteriae TaxID=517724 RepID=UPI001BA4AEEE|nr:hypothetical protein [Kistimonas asteriae]
MADDLYPLRYLLVTHITNYLEKSKQTVSEFAARLGFTDAQLTDLMDMDRPYELDLRTMSRAATLMGMVVEIKIRPQTKETEKPVKETVVDTIPEPTGEKVLH